MKHFNTPLEAAQADIAIAQEAAKRQHAAGGLAYAQAHLSNRKRSTLQPGLSGYPARSDRAGLKERR